MEIKIRDNPKGGWFLTYFGTSQSYNLPIKTKEELLYEVNALLFEELRTEPTEEPK